MDIGRTPFNDPYHLPTNIRPTHYELAIKTDLKVLTFHGYVKSCLDVVVNTSKIVLNTSHIILSPAYIYSFALKTKQPAIVDLYDHTQQRMTYTFKEALPAVSKAELKIPFHSTLADMIKSSWEHDGQKEYYASIMRSLSSACPTAARRVFPCWDEPALKTTFSVAVISRAGTVNLSNMSVISEDAIHSDAYISQNLADLLSMTTECSKEWKITKFETTPLPISAYIMAFANGHFEFLETSVFSPLSGRTIPRRVYSTPDLIHEARYALDVKVAVLPLHEKVLEVEYPLPKLDTIIVNDFEGAIENWGLIVATSSTYLIDPNRAGKVPRFAPEP